MPSIIRTFGAPDFTPRIQELLELAGIAGTPDARKALDWYLQQGWVDSELGRQRGKPAPPELFKQLETSIKRRKNCCGDLESFRLRATSNSTWGATLERARLTSRLGRKAWSLNFREIPRPWSGATLSPYRSARL